MFPTIFIGSNGSRQVASCGAATATVAAIASGRAKSARLTEKLYAEVAMRAGMRDHGRLMSQLKGRGAPLKGKDLISLAQKLARDAERHAILSESLASQADRLMIAGLELLEPPAARPSV